MNENIINKIEEIEKTVQKIKAKGETLCDNIRNMTPEEAKERICNERNIYTRTQESIREQKEAANKAREQINEVKERVKAGDIDKEDIVEALAKIRDEFVEKSTRAKNGFQRACKKIDDADIAEKINSEFEAQQMRADSVKLELSKLKYKIQNIRRD